MEKCDQCHKLLNVKSMKRHKKIHSTRILHTCEHCKRSYTEDKSLRYHMKTHTHTEQLFPCPLCPKIYKSNQALKQHFTIHNWKISRNDDTLGPVEVIGWPEQGNQGDQCNQPKLLWEIKVQNKRYRWKGFSTRPSLRYEQICFQKLAKNPPQPYLHIYNESRWTWLPEWGRSTEVGQGCSPEASSGRPVQRFLPRLSSLLFFPLHSLISSIIATTHDHDYRDDPPWKHGISDQQTAEEMWGRPPDVPRSVAKIFSEIPEGEHNVDTDAWCGDDDDYDDGNNDGNTE